MIPPQVLMTWLFGKDFFADKQLRGSTVEERFQYALVIILWHFSRQQTRTSWRSMARRMVVTSWYPSRRSLFTRQSARSASPRSDSCSKSWALGTPRRQLRVIQMFVSMTSPTTPCSTVVGTNAASLESRSRSPSCNARKPYLQTRQCPRAS